jgi:hypothetical protein
VQEIIDWINTNSGWLGVFIALVPIIWGALQYLSLKRSEIRQKEFENFHSLIRQLVERDDPNVPLKLDRQTAIVFELRNYRPYFEVSIRILTGLKEDWSEYGPDNKRSRLMEEIDATIAHMQSKI